MPKDIYDREGHKTFAQRVQHAVDCWENHTKPMRACRKKMFEHYANQWFKGGPGPAGQYTAQPLNLIDRGVSIIAPLLVSKNPRVMINPRQGTNNPQMGPFSKTLELAMAHLFEEIKLAELTLRPLVIDALFGMGITKTGVMHSHQVEILGYLHDVGQPYCDRVDFEDYISDVAARNRQEVKLEGNWYRLKGQFSLKDMMAQMKQLKKMGPIGKVMEMIHGRRMLQSQVKVDKNTLNYVQRWNCVMFGCRRRM